MDKGVNLSSPGSELEIGELSLARNCHYMPEGGELAKVRGRTVFGSMGAAVAGLSFVKFRSGAAHLIGAAGTSYQSAGVSSSGTFAAIASGLLPVGRMEALYYEPTDRAYISDGVNPMRVWTGSGDARVGGLTRPAAGVVTFIANGTTTYLNGTTFYYCHTEYDPVNDVESPPSPVVQLAASAANGTFRYVFPTKTSAGAKYRLYRSQNGGAVFYRLTPAADIASTILRYYDGTDTEALGSSDNNFAAWGFATMDDQFLATRDILAMVGKPLASNYITANGTFPIGDIMFSFQGSICIAGVRSFPQHLYFTTPGSPEMVTPTNYVPIDNGYGDPITAGLTANDRAVIFTLNTIYRLNALPFPTDPGYGIGIVRKEEVTRDHGCIAKRSVVNFGVGQPNNRAFYLSTRGPMMTDAYQTWPLNEDLDWSERLINMGAISGSIAVNFPKYQQIWLFVPSKNSNVNDMAFIYHYHPNHIKKADPVAVGTWTGPISVRASAGTVAYEANTETRMFLGSADSNVYLADSGLTDAQHCDDASGAINWEWQTGDQPFGEESVNKRVQRVFVNQIGTDSFNPSFRCAVNKADRDFSVPLVNITDNAAGSVKFGTSDVDEVKTRSYRGGVWQTGAHFRWKMQETAVADRQIASVEMEVEEFGRQR